ncbi:MAG: hypothetical protein AAF961_02215, partial [Planctomycetota bacterium]
MKALIWKELHENLRWAVVIFIVAAAAMALIISPYSKSPNWGGIPMLTQTISLNYRGLSSFLLLTTLGGAVSGLALGLLQTLPERGRDQWALLVHRPVTPETILLAKLLVGAGLYLAAWMLPLAGAIAWQLTPGHLAGPFYLPMAYPAIADVTCGLVYYLAGLTIGVRDARWFGSRCLSVGLAVCCSATVYVVPAFWQAMLAIAAFAAAMFLALWCEFTNSAGRPANDSRRYAVFGARTVLGASLLSSLGAIVGLPLLLVLSTFRPVVRDWVNYLLLTDGQIVRVSPEESRLQVADLDGNPVERFDEVGDCDANVYDESVRFSYVYDADAIPSQRMPSSSYRRAASLMDTVYSRGAVVWHYSFVERLFLAYHEERKELLGRLGSNGFSSSNEQPATPFAVNPLVIARENLGVVAFDDAAFRLDLRRRRLDPLYAAEQGAQVVGG